MTRPWGSSYAWVRQAIKERDGEVCYICGKKICERHGHSLLIVEHKDNDEANYSFDNLGFAHRCCNTVKNPRNALPTKREREFGTPEPTLTQSLGSQSEKSSIMRARWLHWINDRINGPFAKFEYISVKSLTKAAPRALARKQLGEESLGVPQSYEDYVEMDSTDFGGPLHIFEPKTGELKGVLSVEYIDAKSKALEKRITIPDEMPE